jgi:hypothetical protein
VHGFDFVSGKEYARLGVDYTDVVLVERLELPA